MVSDDIKNIAIVTKLGLYEWNIMPFGLKYATITFFRTMVKVFKDWNNQFLKVLVDDVNIHNMNWTNHLQHVWTVLQRLRKVHLKLNPNKCCFGVQTITFLGHLVSVKGSHLDLKKIDAMENFPIPKSVTNVKLF
jgi:hypothetical protein